jgi:signal transduction histidine kinase/CheY-like chemotaxis protein
VSLFFAIDRELSSPYQEDVLALRASALHRLIVAGLVVGGLWYAYMTGIREIVDLRLWSGPLVLVICSWLAYLLTTRVSFAAGAGLYIAGVFLTIPLAAWAYADPSLLLLLALAIGVAGLLIGPLAGFLTAALATVALVSYALLSPVVVVPAAVAWRASLFACLMAFLIWVATYPLRTTLHWAWDSYERARRQTEALMEQRGELSRALKDLDLAYRRLEAMAIELERARQAADEARRLKAEFAANISHELRTPLNLIIGFSEMMVMAPRTYGEPLPASYRGDVQAIYRNAQHLSTLIDDVLDLSQIEAGRMGLVKEPIDLAQVAQEAVNAIAYLFEEKGLYLRLALPPQLPTVPADRTRVRQVLLNLLNNAARFTDQGGVTIAAQVDEGCVTISVADTGIGIAESDLPKVFEEFRQLDGSIRRRAGGSGLGLAISKRFVELHGGRMWVSSQLGAGTTFFFSLPLQDSAAPSTLPPPWETWARFSSRRAAERAIVVVDPEPATAHLFARYLEGYRVTAVSDIEAARARMAEEAIHAAIVVAPSGEEGWLQLRRAREGLPTLPMIVCTLQGGAHGTRPGNVVAYMTKPITRERFLSALEQLGPQVRSLLIVDDEREVVRLLSRMARLATPPYRVRTAYSGAEALAQMERRQPDAVVLDLLMPEVDGYTVIEHMQKDPRLSSIPIVIVTARGQEQEVITAGLVGVTRRDGLSVGELMRCVQASLDALRPPVLPGSQEGLDA